MLYVDRLPIPVTREPHQDFPHPRVAEPLPGLVMVSMVERAEAVVLLILHVRAVDGQHIPVSTELPRA